MTNEEYFAVAVDVFPVPNNPGPSAAVVAGMTAGMTAAVIMETTRLHKEATQGTALTTTSIRLLRS
jgi:hypothetical protein